MNEKVVVEIKNLVKHYGGRGFQTQALKGISMSIYENDFIAVMGPSGSGKSTLLNILSTVDKPSEGCVLVDGQDVSRMSNRELSRLRRDKIGFIFQDYNLLDTMTLEDNIALPLALGGVPESESVRRVQEMGRMFGLSEHMKKYPS